MRGLYIALIVLACVFVVSSIGLQIAAVATQTSGEPGSLTGFGTMLALFAFPLAAAAFIAKKASQHHAPKR